MYLPTTLVGWIIVDQAVGVFINRENFDFQLLLTVLGLMLAFTAILFTAPQKLYGKSAEQSLYSSTVMLTTIGIFYFVESINLPIFIELIIGSIGVGLAFNSAYNLVGSIGFVYGHLDDSFRA